MTPLEKKPLSPADAGWAALVGLAALALYVRTVVTIPLPGDSGEFQVLVHQLGAAHTTGYSTYLLLGYLFERLLPFGDVALRVNLFSAVMAALTVALVFLAGKLLTGSRAAAVVGALTLAAGFTFWSQAIIAEVYSTGAAFLSAVLVCVLLWYRTGKSWPIVLAGLLGGAGLGAHGSLGPLGLAVMLFLALNWARRREWLAAGAVGAALGLALYLGGMFLVDANQAPANVFNAAYTPARANWGLSAADVENPVARVWFLVSAGQWRSALFSSPLVDTPVGLFTYFSKLPRDVTLPALALALLGLAMLFRRDWRLATFLLAGLGLQLAVYTNYNVGDRYVFFIPTYVLWSLLAAAGLAELLAAIGRRRWGNRLVQAGITTATAALLIAPLLAPQWAAVQTGTTPFLRIDEYLVKADTVGISRIAAQTTAALEPDALVFTEWHWLYPYYYAAHIEQGKTATRFIETYPRADTRGLAASVLAYVADNIDSRPIYLTSRDTAFTQTGYRLRPVQMGPQLWYRVEQAP